MRCLPFFILITLSIVSCNSYQKASFANDAFMSHKIFKKNYSKYVYLVHDDKKEYLLHDIDVQLNATMDSVSTITGVLKPIPTQLDTSNYIESYTYLFDKRHTVDIFLTENESRETTLNQSISIKEKDVQKVHMNKATSYSDLKVVTKFLAFLVLGFIAIVGFIGLLIFIYDY